MSGKTSERKDPRSWGKIEKRGKRYRASHAHPFGEKNSTGKTIRIFAPKTFGTKKAAETWLAQQLTQIDSGWTPAALSVHHEAMAARAETVEHYGYRCIDSHLTTKGLPLAPKSKDSYRSDLKNLGPEILRMTLGELENNQQVIEKYYRQRISEGKKTSTSHALTLLQQIMTKAVAEGIITKNPCRNHRTGEPLIKGASTIRTNQKADMVLITKEQLAIVEQYLIAEFDISVSMMITVAAWSSVRFGELTELRRMDCIDDGEIITIQVKRSVTHSTDSGCVVKDGTKTGKKGVRNVEVPPEISAKLRDYLAKHVPAAPDALLFPAQLTCHYPESTLTDWWYLARKKAGCESMTFHDLRHFGLTEYARIPGVTLQDIMYRGGHMRIETAMRYQHAANEVQRKEHVRKMATTPKSSLSEGLLGAQVSHAEFGLGMVIGVNVAGLDFVAKIDFDSEGVQDIDLRSAPLRKL